MNPEYSTPRVGASEIWLVRHGETVAQSSIRFYGATDVALSDLGRAQARAVATLLRERVFTRVVASPMCRAREAAHIIVRDPHIPLDFLDDLREIDFGTWEGWTFEDIQTRDPDGFHAWQKHDEAFCFPCGESRAAFRARVERALAHILETGSGAVLVVVHKGVIKSMLRALLHLDAETTRAMPCDLGSVHHLRREHDRWVVVEANLVA